MKRQSHAKNFPAPQHFSLFNSNPQNALFIFFTLNTEKKKEAAPREGPNCARPLETPSNPQFGVSEKIFTSGECLRRRGFPAWSTHVIHAAASLAGDGSPGLKCTEMIPYVFARLTLAGCQMW